MTKRDFIQLAHILRDGQADGILIGNLAWWLEIRYPRFDREKFIAACLDYRG